MTTPNDDNSGEYSDEYWSDEDEDMLLWRLDLTESRADWTLIIKEVAGGDEEGDGDNGDGEDEQETQPKHYHVHKTILGLGAYKSLYLSRLFRQRIPSPAFGAASEDAPPPEIQNKTTIPLPAAEARAFPTLLDFMYSRGVVFPSETLTDGDVSALTRLAHHFSVPSLDRAIQTFMTTRSTKITSSNTNNKTKKEMEMDKNENKELTEKEKDANDINVEKKPSVGEVVFKSFKPIMTDFDDTSESPTAAGASSTPSVGGGSFVSASQVEMFADMTQEEYTALHPEMFRQYTASKHILQCLTLTGEDLCTRVTDFACKRLQDITLSWLEEVMGSNNEKLFTVSPASALQLLHCVVKLSQREAAQKGAQNIVIRDGNDPYAYGMMMMAAPLPPWESSSTLLLKNRCIQTLAEYWAELEAGTDDMFLRLPELIKMQVLQASLHRVGQDRDTHRSRTSRQHHKRPLPQEQAQKGQEPQNKRWAPSTPTR
jgi:hypothetical protein